MEFLILFSSMFWYWYFIYVIDFEGSVVFGILEFGVVMLSGGFVMEMCMWLCWVMGCVCSEDEVVYGLSVEVVVV